MFLPWSCCGKAEEQISSSIRSSKLASDLARVTDRLRARKSYFTECVRAGELMGEAVTNEALVWLEREAMVEETARTLLEEYGNEFTCVCAPNCGSSYTLRRRALGHAIYDAKKLCDAAATIVVTMPDEAPRVVEIPMASSMLGMPRYVARILRDDGVGIIGVWGAPGVGKTTLLNCVNNHFLHDMGFDYVISAVASTVEILQKNIAARLKLRRLPETAAAAALAVFHTLEDKRFLLLLDDVWEAVDLAAVGIPQPSRDHKVVFATRSEHQCRAMEANLSIKLEGLASEDAWSLFKEQLGRRDGEGGVDVLDIPMINKLAEEIVEGCQGIPLALVTVGRAMSVQGSSLASWQRASALLRRRPSAIPGMEEHVFPSIKLSYDMLPTDIVRNCFLHCSLWPANCSIGTEELIDSWMGLGLMNETTTDINQAYDSGHFVIETLKSACMLEPAGRGGVEMTSVMRGFAHWVASDCGKDHTRWLLRSGPMEDLEEWRSAEHISLTHSQIRVLPSLQAPLVCPNLTTLVLSGNSALNSIPNCFFEGMPCLRYLDLSDTGIEELPKEIGILTELIYLNLSRTYITSLPKEMEKLAKLKYLRLQRTMHLMTVPGGLLSSLSLHVLDLTGSGYQFHLRDSRHGGGGGGDNIKQLGSLRKGVRAIGITVISVPALRWLSGLSRMPIRRLWIISLDCKAEPTLELLSSELLGSSNIRESLRELAIKHSKDLEVMAMVDAGGLPRLETLHLVQLTGLKKISWYGSVPALSLPYLRELHISFCPKLKHVTWVLRLPCLQHLSLRGCTQMEAVINEIDSDERVVSAKSHLEKDDRPTEFPNLKELVMEDLPMMESIYKMREERLTHPAAFPCLKTLCLSGCPKLTRLPFDLGKLESIRCEEEWWEKVRGEEISSSLDPCVVYVTVAAPPPPPPLPPVPPRSLVLLRNGMNTAVLFLGGLVFRAFFVSLVFVLIKASPPDFLLFFSVAVSLAGWIATRWRWMKRKITRLGFPI